MVLFERCEFKPGVGEVIFKFYASRVVKLRGLVGGFIESIGQESLEVRLGTGADSSSHDCRGCGFVVWSSIMLRACARGLAGM